MDSFSPIAPNHEILSDTFLSGTTIGDKNTPELNKSPSIAITNLPQQPIGGSLPFLKESKEEVEFTSKIKTIIRFQTKPSQNAEKLRLRLRQKLVRAEKETEKTNADQTAFQVVDCFKKAMEFLQQGKLPQARFVFKAGSALNRAVEEGQREEPNQVVIDRYKQSSASYKQAADALSRSDIVEADSLSRAGHSLSNAAVALQKGSPLAAITSDCYHQAAAFYKRAALAPPPNDPKQALYLNNAGFALFCAAEMLKKIPAEYSKKFQEFLQTSGFGEYAKNTFDPDYSDQTALLNKAITALIDFPINEEELSYSQKEQLAQRRILFEDLFLHKSMEAFTRYLRAVEDLKKAVRIFDSHKPRQVAQANYLEAIALDLIEVVQEDQKESPNHKVVQHYNSAAECDRKAVEALNEVDGDEEASFYHRAALSYREAAKETQQVSPDQTRIIKLVQKGATYQERARQALLSKKSCVIM